MPVTNTLKQLLPELQQIEVIVHLGNKTDLCSEVLCHVSCDSGMLSIYVLTLGNSAKEVPSITYIAGIHGLERIGTQVVIAFLEGLLERLKWDQVLVDILQRVCINFLPLINPVGMLNYTRANGRGVDLMRNAPIDSHEKTI